MKNVLIGLGVLLLPLAGVIAFGGKGSCRVGVECEQMEVVERRIHTTIISGCDRRTGYMTRSRTVRNWKTKCDMRSKARSRRTQFRKSRIIQAGLPRLRTLRLRTFSEKRYRAPLAIRRSTRSQYGRYGCVSHIQKCY